MKRCIDYIQQQMENNIAKRFNILSVIVAVIAYINSRIKKNTICTVTHTSIVTLRNCLQEINKLVPAARPLFDSI